MTMKTITSTETGHVKQLIKTEDEDAYIDTKIIPLVKWINTLPNCHTVFSCEGDITPQKNGNINLPYIMLKTNNKIIKNIKLLLKNFSKNNPKKDMYLSENMSIKNGKSITYYHFSFSDQKTMIKFTKYCKSCYINK